MDRIALQLIQDCVNSRTRAIERLTYWPERSQITTTILEQERRILTLISDILSRQRTPITFTIPLDFGNLENVVVAPTQQQIINALIPLNASSTQNCSICQDTIQVDGCQLRGCNHSYHRSCIQLWFTTSVHCPICRRDVREDLSSQISSVSQ
jgi:hypothetical protein